MKESERSHAYKRTRVVARQTVVCIRNETGWIGAEERKKFRQHWRKEES
jgi:hypothetical protein